MTQTIKPSFVQGLKFFSTPVLLTPINLAKTDAITKMNRTVNITFAIFIRVLICGDFSD